MWRNGLSISMSYVVVGLVLVVTSLAVLGYFTNSFGLIKDISSGQLGEGKNQVAQNSCLTQMERMCEKEEYQGEGTKWASEAFYNGQPCEEYWENEPVPECGG